MSVSMLAAVRVGNQQMHVGYTVASYISDCILKRSSEMQQYAGVCLLQNYSITLHVSGVNRAHHQDYIKV